MATTSPSAPTPQKPTQEVAVFLNSVGSSAVMLPTGKPVHFVGGKTVTDDPEVIKYLDECIAKGVTYISRGDAVDAVMPGSKSPLDELRRKFYAEFVEANKDLQAKLSGGNDFGSSAQGSLNPVSSSGVKVLAAGN